MKKFSFIISGNAYDVEILNFQDNTAEIDVNGSHYIVELQQEMKVTKTPTLLRNPVPSPTLKETKITKTLGKTTNTTVKSPLPGIILHIFVKEGDRVSIGAKLFTIEAMKMENIILAERDGIVKNIAVKTGDNVMQSDLIMEIE